MHVWDECVPALMQFDVYSCGEFDPEVICKKITKDFDVAKIEYKFLNRETGLQDIGGAYLKPVVSKSQTNKILFTNRKEVEINKNGSGYTIKEGSNKDKVLGHIATRSKEI